jgi:16S rRNA (guanine527-N7)-methyltransferase
VKHQLQQSLAQPALRVLLEALGDNQEQWCGRCVEHWEWMQAWQQHLNLTSITTFKEAIWRHYLDSIALLPHIEEGSWRVVDIGTGAGFPGLIMALARPNWHFTLVEPRRKRCSFLQYAVAQWALNNVNILCLRHEEQPKNMQFDMVVTRATFSEWSTLRSLKTWLAPGGDLWLWRGDCPPADSYQGTLWPYLCQDKTRYLWQISEHHLNSAE